MSRFFDSFIVLSERWKKPISVISIAWFVLTCAAYARFIELPKIEILTDRAATIASGFWNAIWWGMLRPMIERRRLAISNTEVQNG